MAVTANGTPYVETSDLVANYPGVSLALANHIDDNTGKILQVVRAIDSTNRTTTSTSFVDVTGMSVTITPQRNTSAVLLISTFQVQNPANSNIRLQITDAANSAISGSSVANWSLASGAGGISMTIIGWATPATLSATTYKLRFNSLSGGTAYVFNSDQTGQMYAIEVAA